MKLKETITENSKKKFLCQRMLKKELTAKARFHIRYFSEDKQICNSRYFFEDKQICNSIVSNFFQQQGAHSPQVSLKPWNYNTRNDISFSIRKFRLLI